MRLVRRPATCRLVRRTIALLVRRATVRLVRPLRIAMCSAPTCTMFIRHRAVGITPITPHRIVLCVAPRCIAADKVKRRPLLMSDGAFSFLAFRLLLPSE